MPGRASLELKISGPKHISGIGLCDFSKSVSSFDLPFFFVRSLVMHFQFPEAWPSGEVSASRTSDGKISDWRNKCRGNVKIDNLMKNSDGSKHTPKSSWPLVRALQLQNGQSNFILASKSHFAKIVRNQPSRFFDRQKINNTSADARVYFTKRSRQKWTLRGIKLVRKTLSSHPGAYMVDGLPPRPSLHSNVIFDISAILCFFIRKTSARSFSRSTRLNYFILQDIRDAWPIWEK